LDDKNKGKSQNQAAKGHINGDPKCSYLAMATISFSGDALPLYMLARGKTQMCEQQVKEKNGNIVSHSGNGWVTLQVKKELFESLLQIVENKYHINRRQHILLLFDFYVSHREGTIKEIAKAQRIKLLFNPPGMTTDLQPLDAEIFGQLKSAGSKIFLGKYLIDPSYKFSRAEASLVLQYCWAELDRTKILKAWQVIIERAKELLEGVIEVPTKKVERSSDDNDDKNDADYQEPPKKPARRKTKK
jgi:hypothetical protein